MKDDVKKSYLKGFEAGLKEAWLEISRLTTRGYSSTELNIMAKSKLAVVQRDVEARARQIEQAEVDVEDVESVRAPDGLPDRQGSYIVKEQRAVVVFDYFAALLSQGRHGLCMTRTHPRELAEHFDVKGVKFLWLSKIEGEAGGNVQSVSPTELAKLASQAVSFMEKEKQSSVLLEGIEYLISQNGFPSVLKFVQMLNERSMLHDSYVLLSVNPEAIGEREYRQLAKEMTGEL